MSQLEEKTRSRVGRTEVTEGSSSYEHVPPPSKLAFKKSDPSNKALLLKSIFKYMYISDDEADKKRTKENVTSSGDYKSRKIGYLEYIFYKCLLVFLFIIYGIYRYFQLKYNFLKLKIYNIYYNPSNTPQLIRQDVTQLSKIPKRLAAILEIKPVGDVDGGINGLLNDASRLVCWTVSAGIKHLMLYDYDGLLQRNVHKFREEIYNKLMKYYGPTNTPNFAVKIPHSNKVYYNNTDEYDNIDTKVVIEISLLSNRDGRETIVDLTKTMAELCAAKELKISDITMDLVDSELTQLVGHEPDLLLYFGPSLDLQGFPPWHIRLTEFYWEPDNNAVTYSIFIRGLKNYAGAKINVGK